MFHRLAENDREESMTDRTLLANAWADGWKAGLNSLPRASNPYINKQPALAKEWDRGWCEANQ